MDLITNPRARINLPNAPASDDTTIDILISAASRAIIKYCQRDFVSTGYDELYNGNGDRRLVLRQYPILGVQSVRERPPPDGAGRCAHAIAIPGCLYEIGLVRRRGHFLPAWDDAPDGGLNEVLGPNAGVLWQAYVAEMTRRAAFHRGHHYSRHTDYAGTLRLRIVADGKVAHVRVNRDGQPTLWIFDSTYRSTFRYLADALGRVESEALLEIAAQEPSLEPRTSVETIHESAALDRPLLAVGNNCPAKPPPPPAPTDGGGPVGTLSPVQSRHDCVHGAAGPAFLCGCNEPKKEDAEEE